MECVAIASLSLLCAGLGVASGYGRHYLVFVLLPRMATDTFLAYSFDYAPHHPHATPRSTDIYACTSMIGGLLDPADGVDLTYPLIYQVNGRMDLPGRPLSFCSLRQLIRNHF